VMNKAPKAEMDRYDYRYEEPITGEGWVVYRSGRAFALLEH
jgi:hypothetical protein